MTLLIAFCVISQTLAAITGFFRYPRNRRRILNAILELAALANIFCVSLLHAKTMHEFTMNIYVPGGFVLSRYIVFSTVLIPALSVILLSELKTSPTHFIIPLTAVASAGLTLPAVENATGRAFLYIYVYALLFWLVRSVLMNISRYRELSNGISALSVKNAIDSLGAGVMFCEDNGFVILSNTRMMGLMAAITGKVHRNGRYFYSLLTLGEIDPGCRVTWLENQNVCLLPDGSAWMFTTTDMPIKNKKYVQLTATDVTERWKLTAELQPRNEELVLRQNLLNGTIANLNVLSRERETQKARMRTHDILGERLTILLRMVRGEQTPDYSLLRSLTRGLADELNVSGGAPSAVDDVDSLKQAFMSIGVDICVEGDIPADETKGRLAADIVREAVTNAVRHGYATKINVQISGVPGDIGDSGSSGSTCSPNSPSSPGVFILRITDNGQPPSAPVKEGGGISGMREKVKPYGGFVSVETSPAFMLEVNLGN